MVVTKLHLSGRLLFFCCLVKPPLLLFFNYYYSILLFSMCFSWLPSAWEGDSLLGGLISSRRGIESGLPPFLLSAVIGVQVHCCCCCIHPAATRPPHIEQRRPPLLLSIPWRPPPLPRPHFSAGRRTQWGTFFHTWAEKNSKRLPLIAGSGLHPARHVSSWQVNYSSLKKNKPKSSEFFGGAVD